MVILVWDYEMTPEELKQLTDALSGGKRKNDEFFSHLNKMVFGLLTVCVVWLVSSTVELKSAFLMQEMSIESLEKTEKARGDELSKKIEDISDKIDKFLEKPRFSFAENERALTPVNQRIDTNAKHAAAAENGVNALTTRVVTLENNYQNITANQSEIKASLKLLTSGRN